MPVLLVMICRAAIFFLIVVAASSAVDPRAKAVSDKIDLIESGKARRGSVIAFTAAELNAWVSVKAPEEVPEGLREPRIELGNNVATGYARIDLLKVRHGAGVDTNWLVAKMIQGEKPVKVVARIQSWNGRARVHLQRVEIGGLAVSGTTLDFLISTFLMPLYPNAKIDQWFDLSKSLDHIEIVPAEARAYVKK